jgi:citrate lyase subunit beta / citryl-CoA lyase
MRLRRSELSTPASNEKMITKAAASDADLVFLDLEDSVAPAEKPAARDKAVRAFRDLDWGRKVRAIRVNGLETEWFYDDLTTVVAQAGDHIDVIIVPKVKSADDVTFTDRLLGMAEKRNGTGRRIGLEVLIEEVEGMVNVAAIAAASPRLEALIFGPGDYSASQGINHAAARAQYDDLWYYARNQVVIAARSAGIEAVDGPFGGFNDPDGYRRECRRSLALGFTGKWAIHPSQIALANEEFSPSPDEVATARRRADAYQQAVAAGNGAVGVDGTMIDAVVMRGVDALLERASLIGIKVPETA